jgi:hypothetical protein
MQSDMALQPESRTHAEHVFAQPPTQDDSVFMQFVRQEPPKHLAAHCFSCWAQAAPHVRAVSRQLGEVQDVSGAASSGAVPASGALSDPAASARGEEASPADASTSWDSPSADASGREEPVLASTGSKRSKSSVHAAIPNARKAAASAASKRATVTVILERRSTRAPRRARSRSPERLS